MLWESIEEDLLRLIRAGSFGEIPRERLDTIETLQSLSLFTRNEIIVRYRPG